MKKPRRFPRLILLLAVALVHAMALFIQISDQHKTGQGPDPVLNGFVMEDDPGSTNPLPPENATEEKGEAPSGFVPALHVDASISPNQIVATSTPNSTGAELLRQALATGVGRGARSDRVQRVQAVAPKDTPWKRLPTRPGEKTIVMYDASESACVLVPSLRERVAEFFPSIETRSVQGALFMDEHQLEAQTFFRTLPVPYRGYCKELLSTSILVELSRLLASLTEKEATIYFISDFRDFVDPASVETIVRSLKTRNIRFVAIGLAGPPPDRVRRMCQETNGGCFYAGA